MCLFRADPRSGTPEITVPPCGSVAVSQQGLCIQPGQRNSSQKPRWALPDPCWAGRHSRAGMLAVFPWEVHLVKSWEKLNSLFEEQHSLNNGCSFPLVSQNRSWFCSTRQQHPCSENSSCDVIKKWNSGRKMKPVTTLGIVFIALFVLKHLIHCPK